MPNEFPGVSWGLCVNRIKPLPSGDPYCDMPTAGPLYNGECHECRFLFAPSDEARIWASLDFWEKTIAALPEPLPRSAVLQLYDRMSRMAKGEGEKYIPEVRGIALQAARKLAAYGREHYPAKVPDNTP